MMWFRLMLQTNFNASMSGLIWEKIVVNFLCKKLFKSNTALSESGMFQIKKKKSNRAETINYKYLPEDFERPLIILSGLKRLQNGRKPGMFLKTFAQYATHQIQQDLISQLHFVFQNQKMICCWIKNMKNENPIFLMFRSS